jgi:hypothetical protein
MMQQSGETLLKQPYWICKKGQGIFLGAAPQTLLCANNSWRNASMDDHSSATMWTCTGSIVTIESPWVRLLGEHWVDERGRALEYWRVERAHSVIVMPIWRGQLLLPHPQFRPGVQRLTLDLPGGRLPPGVTPVAAVAALLHKELGLHPNAIARVAALNEQGWVINSSFSNQLLYGVVAMINDDAEVALSRLHRAVPCTIGAIAELIQELECLQCRAVLQTWLLQHVNLPDHERNPL